MMMKQAKVVSVRRIDVEDAEPHARETSLLRRYPQIAEEDRRELLRFVRKASPADLRKAFLSRGLEGKLIRFRTDHKDQLRSGFAAFTPYILGLMLAIMLLSSFLEM
ncbi:MAG TPA: hypothetical protein VNT25_04020 [Allosphingosinicella sp.]|jgi:hypothetical protein|nr:hypothetical protein [Allosphingosinicella sp.]